MPMPGAGGLQDRPDGLDRFASLAYAQSVEGRGTAASPLGYDVPFRHKDRPALGGKAKSCTACIKDDYSPAALRVPLPQRFESGRAWTDEPRFHVAACFLGGVVEVRSVLYDCAAAAFEGCDHETLGRVP